MSSDNFVGSRNKSIAVVFTIFLILLTFIFSGCGKENTADNDANKPIEIESIEVLYESDGYIDKKIKVTGLVGLYDTGEGSMKMYGEYTDVEVYLKGSEKYDLPESECATVVGTVKVTEYDEIIIQVEKLTPCTDELCSHNEIYYDEGLTFADKVDACTRFSNMNWAQFYQYPDTYNDGQTYYIVGKVIWIDGVGGGLMQLVNGNNNTIVEFTTSNGDQIYKNEIIALFGNIGSGGEYTKEGSDQVYSCPYFFAEECIRGDQALSVDSLSEEEYDFIFTDYSTTSGYYSSNLGKSFSFTEDTIAGYHYTINTFELTYGSTLVSSYDICSNNLKYFMNIDVNINGEIEQMYVFIRLDGNVEFDNNYYYR